jgi:hypothetical protein
MFIFGKMLSNEIISKFKKHRDKLSSKQQTSKRKKKLTHRKTKYMFTNFNNNKHFIAGF